jgi:hypothetical protein
MSIAKHNGLFGELRSERFKRDGLSYKLPPTANYLIDRRSVQFFTSSAGTFTAQGVRNFAITMTSENGFADLHTCRLAFRIKNAAADNGDPDLDVAGVGGGAAAGNVFRLKPKGSGPWAFISRLRVFAGGQLIEDLYPYSRVH